MRLQNILYKSFFKVMTNPDTYIFKRMIIIHVKTCVGLNTDSGW